MPEFIQQLRRSIVRGPLHRPSLITAASYQWWSYQLQTTDIIHQPKVLCIGNFKTGTVSLDGLLGQQLKGAHEPHAYLFARTWFKYAKGRISQDKWKEFLVRRSNALTLDFEASGFLTTEAPLLAELFPNAKFVLTIRDPESWCRSMLRHIIKNRTKLGYHYWEPVLRHWFTDQPEATSDKAEAYWPHAQHEFPTEESSLKNQDLYPLKGLLDYWQQSNVQAIETIPEERLLILDTKKLSESIEQLAMFLNLEVQRLRAAKSHLHASLSSSDPLAALDSGLLKHVCEPYQRQFKAWVQQG